MVNRCIICGSPEIDKKVKDEKQNICECLDCGYRYFELNQEEQYKEKMKNWQSQKRKKG